VALLENAYWIPLLPLLAGALIIFFGRFLPLQGAWLGILAMAYGLVHSALLVKGIFAGDLTLPYEGLTGRFFETSATWFSTGLFRMEVGLLIDGMTVVMLLVVTLVSFLVQVYSLGYQHGKPRFGRYYAYLSLFTFSMLLLVLANNYLQFFIGWEIMGLCSYLLIGFEFERPAAAYASRKAFITTRVGDLGLTLGLLLIFSTVGTFNFAMIHREHVVTGLLSPAVAGAIALLLFCGACGKSAQVPLHVWLPDAMEGPTPVSALIHAATMVAAGVYLVARSHFIFALSGVALATVAWVGCLTALIAASSALVANDIKKVLAYSTISQLGFMMLALGVGDVRAGIFHLTTHAFFKALLFLGAGSVIHAVHTNDIWQMGGLSRKMPLTFMTMACGTLAIIGFPFTSGFFSKEEILGAVHGSHQPVLFALAAFTAFLTAFYMCRLLFVVFLGDPKDPHKFSHAHESEASMTLPLGILAVFSLAAGFFLTYEGLWPFDRWVPGEKAHHEGYTVLLVSLSVFGAGSVLAWSMYLRGAPDPARMAARWSGVYACLGRRYLDEFYLWIIGRVYHPVSRALSRFDYDVLDQFIVDGFGWAATQISRLKRWFDDVVLDGVLVNGVGRVTGLLGSGLRLVQTGFAQFYLLVIASGLSLMVAWAVGVFG
jgi:NADH-quinone oxidoreductase subunit L